MLGERSETGGRVVAEVAAQGAPQRLEQVGAALQDEAELRFGHDCRGRRHAVCRWDQMFRNRGQRGQSFPTDID
jgi:hypothetical protein